MLLRRDLRCDELTGRVVFWTGGNRPTQELFLFREEEVGATLKACFLLADTTVAAASYFFESELTRRVTHTLQSLFACGDVLYFVDEAVESFAEHGVRKMEKSPASLMAYNSADLVAQNARELAQLGFILRRPAVSISDLLAERWINDLTASDSHSLGGAILALHATGTSQAVLRKNLIEIAQNRTTDFVWEAIAPVLASLSAPRGFQLLVRRRLAEMYGETTAKVIGATVDTADHRLSVDVSGPLDALLFQQVLAALGADHALNLLEGRDCVAIKKSPEWVYFDAFYSKLVNEVGKLEVSDLRVLPVLKDAERVWADLALRPRGISRAKFLRAVVRLCRPLTRKAVRFIKPTDFLLETCEVVSRAPIGDFIQLLVGKANSHITVAFRRQELQSAHVAQQTAPSTASEVPTGEPAPPDFQLERELTDFLRNWVRSQWNSQAAGGTGRSGNVLFSARWRGQPALLKISADAAGLRAEAAHLDMLGKLDVGLSVARLFARAEVLENDDRWMGYLMEPVGEMSLRDYLFTATPSPQKFLASLGTGLAALYCRTARPTTRDFVADYLKAIREGVEKARGYAPFAGLAVFFDGELHIKGAPIAGPGAILATLEQRLKQNDATLRALNPAHDCHVHGDLHFENVRVNPAEAAVGLHWLIDPKEFDRGDYVYDLAKLLTSLTGHAHADIGEHEKGNPRLKWTAAGDGRIDFNCILTKRQVQGWQEGLAAIEALARDAATQLENDGDRAAAEAAVKRMKQRLMLALARHFFSAVRFFLKPEAQWLLFARGTQFLAMFQASLAGKEPEEWDLFKVCRESAWLETP